MKKLFKRYKKPIISMFFLIILASLGYWLYLSYQKSSFRTVGKKDIVTNQTDSNTNVIPKQSEGASSSAANNVDVSKNTAEVPVSNETTAEITQLYQDGNGIVYQAAVTNPGASGTCSAVFTKVDSRPVTQVNAAVGSTCGPFTVARANFDMRGNWLLTLRYYNNNAQSIATKTIEIK